MKKIIVISLIVILGLVGLSVARDQILKQVIVFSASKVTGARVSLGGFSLSVIKQSVRLKNLRMMNPPDFGSGTLIDIPLVYIDCQVFSLLKGEFYIPKASFEIKEMFLVKNKEGKLNVDSLKVAQKKEEKKPKKEMGFKIDKLGLKMGRVIYKDFSVEGEPVVRVYDIGLDKTYKNIDSARQLSLLLLTEPMKSAGIRGAAIYGVSALVGVAILPVAAVATLVGKDYAEESFNRSYGDVYRTALRVAKRLGSIKSEDMALGVISATIHDADVTITINKSKPRPIQVTVSARKFMVPQQEIAGGILYQITQELK